MKLFKTALCVGLVSFFPLLQGCVVVAGGVLAGGTYGAVSYASNTLLVTEKVSLEKAWTAANDALKELQMPVQSIKKDKTSAKVTAKNAKNQDVIIKLASKADQSTELQISVGAFDTEANRAAEQQVYDKMRIRFN